MVPPSLLALCVLGFLHPFLAEPSRLQAQYPEVDSARVAREAWRQAAPLVRRGEWAAARDQLRRAFEAWPAQQYYISVYASLSARLSDTAQTIRALAHLADLGLSLDVTADSDFALVRDAPALQPVIRRLATNAAPFQKSTLAAVVAQDDFFPEGMSHDSARGVWYVGSVRHRKVTRITHCGSAGLHRHRGLVRKDIWHAQRRGRLRDGQVGVAMRHLQHADRAKQQRRR